VSIFKSNRTKIGIGYAIQIMFKLTQNKRNTVVNVNHTEIQRHINTEIQRHRYTVVNHTDTQIHRYTVVNHTDTNNC
jgi:hypothetical protein